MKKFKIFFIFIFLYCSITVQAMVDLNTQLIIAVKNNQIEDVKKFISLGADINASTLDKKTPLIWATVFGYKPIIEFLLNQPKIEIDLKDKEGITALGWAATRDYLEISKLLVKAGADTNTQDIDGTTPLMAAVFANNVDIINFLLEQPNIDLTLKNTADQTALNIAEYLKYNKIVDLIKEKMKGKKEDFKDTDLFIAINEGNLNKVKNLISKGANVNIQDKTANTPLILATSKNYVDIVKELLNHPQILVNLANFLNATALSYAVSENNVKIVQLLLDHKDIDVNVQDLLKATPLMIAVENNNFEIIKLLLNHPNIDLALENIDNKTALDLAIDLNKDEIARLIKTKIEKTIQNTKQKFQNLSQILSALARAIKKKY